jgi:hypothetical protein
VVEYPSCRQKVQVLLFNSKWDTLSVLNIRNEKYFVSKNRDAAPLSNTFKIGAKFYKAIPSTYKYGLHRTKLVLYVNM